MVHTHTQRTSTRDAVDMHSPGTSTFSACVSGTGIQIASIIADKFEFAQWDIISAETPVKGLNPIIGIARL